MRIADIEIRVCRSESSLLEGSLLGVRQFDLEFLVITIRTDDGLSGYRLGPDRPLDRRRPLTSEPVREGIWMMESNRVALITGAGSGIGRASSVALGAAGFAVVLTGRHLEPLEETAERCRRAGTEALVVPADITDPVSVDALFARVREQFGRLDLLFNNAGRSAPPTSIEDLPIETWRSVVDTNLTGAFLATQGAFRLMKSQDPRGGRIINNGSISAHVPRPRSAAYTASKHAITGLTRATSLDGRAYDIACGQIDIGNAATEMAGPMIAGTLQADGSVAIEPTIDVEHVARAVVFMASLPLEANVQFLTVMATKMPYIGRG